MKICAILSILALAAPSAVATKRKRIFKVYSPEEIQRLEGTDDEGHRLLKGDDKPGDKPGDDPKNQDMSMSMPEIVEDMSMPATSMSMPGSSYCTWSPEPECYPATMGWPACCTDDAVECPPEQPECEIAETTAETTSPIVIGSGAPSPAPMRQIMMTDSPVVVVTDPPVVVVTDPPVTDPPVAVVTDSPTTTVDPGGFTMPPVTQPPNPFASDAQFTDSATGTDDKSGAAIMGTSLAAVAVVGALIFV